MASFICQPVGRLAGLRSHVTSRHIVVEGFPASKKTASSDGRPPKHKTFQASAFVIRHWSKQVTWLSLESRFRETGSTFFFFLMFIYF